MGAKHTDGPWIWASRRTPQAKVYDVIGAGLVIARVHEGGVKRAEANARLIASAPDLLEALSLLLSHDEQDAGCLPTDAHRDAQQAARAAIARATGEAA
jgi:hypothetical protein